MAQDSRGVAESAGGRRAGARLVGALGIVVVAYSLAPLGGLAWDDHSLITETPEVRQRQPLAYYFSHFFWSGALHPEVQFYRPLVTLSYAVEYQIWGADPAGFHASNVVLHLVCTGLLWGLCRRAGASPDVAAVLAAGFGLFPRLTESVAWISGRTDVAAGAFILAALLAHRRGPGAWGRKIVAAACLLAALLCKEVALAAFVALALLQWRDAHAAGARLRRTLVDLLPAIAAAAVYAALRLHAAQMEGTPVLASPSGRGPAPLVALEALGSYATMVLDPLRPRLQIGLWQVRRWWLVAAGALALGAGLWAVVRFRRRLDQRQWSGIGLSVASLMLVLHIVPLNLEVVAADRYLYVPLAGLVLALARPVQQAARRWSRQAPLAAIAVAVLGLFAVATLARTRDWIDELRLWREAVRTTPPANEVPTLGLAHALMQRGRWDEALAVLEPIPRRNPGAPRASLICQTNIALALDKLGHHDRAIALLRSVLRDSPERLRARYNLILAYARAGRFSEASAQARDTVHRFPTDGHARELAGLVEATERAFAALPTMRSDEPAQTRAERARLYAGLGAAHEASQQWAALVLDPTAPAALRVEGAGYLAVAGHVRAARRTLMAIEPAPPAGLNLPAVQAALADRLEPDD